MPHTPGPWDFHRITLGHPDNELNPIVSAPGCYIARLFFQGSTISGMTSRGAETLEEAEANARLITAAPDYHTAVKGLLELWPLSGHELEAYMDATFIPAAAEAFAKATQRS